MLLFLQAVKCYKDNAILQGNSQTKVLVLQLTPQPENDLLCVASASRDSVCQLQYIDASNVVQNLTSSYIYSNITENIINFDLSADSALYDFIAKQSLLSYIALIVGSLESPGAIQTIQHTQMNATNCWSDLTLLYDREDDSAFLEMDGKPLDCQIESPVVQIQYFINGTWIPINVKGVNEPGFYFAGRVFDHQTILHYKQNLADLTDKTDITNFKNFFVEFQKNRRIQTRLFLTTKDGTLDQIIIAQPQHILSHQSKCYNSLEPEAYGSPLQILAFSKNYLFPNSVICNQKTTKISSQLIVNSLEYNFSSSIENNTFAQFEKRVGFVVNLNNSIPNFEQIKSATLVSYLTLYDEDDNILNEESILLELKLTCIESLQTYFQKDKLCLQIRKIQNIQCASIKEIQLIQVLGLQLGDFTHRQIAFTFEMTYILNGKKQCTSMYSSCDYAPNIIGTVQQITKFYEKSIANKTKTFNFLQGQNEFVFSTLVLLTNFQELFLFIGLFIGFIAICSTTGVLIYLKTYLRT